MQASQRARETHLRRAAVDDSMFEDRSALAAHCAAANTVDRWMFASRTCHKEDLRRAHGPGAHLTAQKNFNLKQARLRMPAQFCGMDARG